MASRAHDFFKQIKGPNDLKRLVEEHQPETEFLDFKSGKAQKDEKNMKKIWSEALSGFANTEGGVLIWGIFAKSAPLPEDPSIVIDAAQSLDLVPKASHLAQRLKDYQLDAVQDALHGIEIKPIEFERDGSGCVVCFIPEGNHKPYRAPLAEKAYYHRVGDKFQVIPHSILRSLFYPQLRPRLQIDASLELSLAPSLQFEVTCRTRIRNFGQASAEEMQIIVRSDKDAQLYPAKMSFELGRSAKNAGMPIQRFHSKEPLHPSERSLFINAKWRPGQVIDGHMAAYAQKEFLVQYINQFDWKIDVAVFMRNQEPAFFQVCCTKSELNRGYVIVSNPVPPFEADLFEE